MGQPEQPQRRDGLEIPPDVLDLDDDELRRLGYWVVDRTVEHLATLRDRPALTARSFDELAAVLGGPVPRERGNLDDALGLLVDVALEAQQHGDHPRYFARVPGPSSAVAVIGEWLATGMQSIASSWGGASGPTTVELVALGWLRDAVGLRPGSEGVMVSGGSMANLTALVAARAAHGDGVVYLSDQTHASIARGLAATGQPAGRLRVLPTDAGFRLDPVTLADAVTGDLARGLRPRVVVATAGTTNTGAVDDLAGLASVCRAHDLWLHVDGAYGGPAALTDVGRRLIGPLELADSFVLDPHKWLFQPYDVACCFVARPGALAGAFTMQPEYLADVVGDVDLRNRSPELTRRARAVKVWLTIRTYGTEALGRAVQRGMALAEHAQVVVERTAQLEVVTPAQLGVVTFRDPVAGDAAHVAAAADLTRDGFAAVSTTVLRGQTVLRLCTINPRTTTDDVEQTIHRLAHLLHSR